MEKRGQGLSVNAIILIVLGIVVLAALIFGFTAGFGGLKDKIIPSNNVQTIVSSCQTACATQSAYDFCTVKRELNAEGDDKDLKDVTCNYLAQKQTGYGIDACSSISCENMVLSAEETDCGGNEGKTIQYLDADKRTLISKDCPSSIAP